MTTFSQAVGPKKPERLRTQIFVDPGISHWAIQLDHFSNKRKVSNRGTDIDQYQFCFSIYLLLSGSQRVVKYSFDMVKNN